jgi:SAM-dependent methyltransferase
MTTPPKPACWAPEYAQVFNLESVARAYHFRPPYPEGLFTTLAALMVDQPRTLLDLGCGPGDLARNLVHAAERVDAIDASMAMIERGRAMERGSHPNLRWIHGWAEDAPLQPPYALVTAGDSINWMDWGITLPRIKAALSPNGSLAIVGRVWGTGSPGERDLWRRFSTNSRYRPLNVIEELVSGGLFQRRGEKGFNDAWTPTIDEYLGACRSRASYPTNEGRAEAFDEEMRALLERLLRSGRLSATGGWLALTVTAGVVWGAPKTPNR